MRPRSILTICLTLLLTWTATATAQSSLQFKKLREEMVRTEIIAAGITNQRVINSLMQTPRHDFVPMKERKYAYLDMALPIGEQQTISPPFVVAYMTEKLDPQPSDTVLEIGTGSGYQAAVLSPLVKEVYSIEIVGSLGRKAERTLKRLKYENVHTKVGDGFLGWPSKAPFDKIIVTCSPENVPQPLVDQLNEGGQMVIPVGERYHQNLVLMRKRDGKLEEEQLQGTFFVPMTGAAEERRELLPDDTNPELTNGSFEILQADKVRPEGWHYLRQVKVVKDPTGAPEGNNYLQFKNEVPGRGCRALQGFAINGREVSGLKVSFSARGRGLRYGQSRKQWPFLVITFYDDRRAALSDGVIGPFVGDFPWTRYNETMRVPLGAKEAIIRIGLLGGIGELAYDNLAISPIKQ